VPPPLTKQQLSERSAQCEKATRDQFRRAWKDGSEVTAEGRTSAQFVSRYNPKLQTCFYLLTVTSPATLKRMLFDVNGGELYGEYLGPAQADTPAARPKTCRVEAFYCASAGEWEVLVRPYLEE